MKRIALQPRLRLLAEMTPSGGRLADIGTDHGYLPVWLLQEGRIPSAIASGGGAAGTRPPHGGGIRDTGAGLPAL